ncbi:thioredoxin family protein [Chthoniobacter flavus]|nr:thioredoxin domain-containing protein [Chthoniobacter flavus]
MIPQITAAQFAEQVTASKIPVLVDFFSDHCHFCQELLPVLADVATEQTESLRIFKFDAGAEPEFAARFGIRAVPNLVLFQNGGPVGQRSGFSPKRDLLAWIGSALRPSIAVR